MENLKMMKLAAKTFELILETIESGEDYSLIMNQYNGLVEYYKLNLPRIGWVSNSEFRYI